ncbi:hypothetical protein BDV97DRAFT_361279 [Delphinella strobiligena]|nr:hypothetical protein BDV97DRAFT_361279 [Delphinella strobiligena]
MTSDGYRSDREHSTHRDSSEQRQASQRSYAYCSSDMDDSRDASRSRASSTAGMPNGGVNATPPLHDAINVAVRDTDARNLVDPGLVAQITREVTKNVLDAFAASKVTIPTPAQQAHQPISVDTRRSESPEDFIRSFSPRQMTPPSPGRYDAGSQHSSSPERATSETSYASTDMPRRSRRRESNTSLPPDGDTPIRPRPVRAPTAVHEITISEKIWTPLFNNGRPTARLGQFLRGLAIHLIEDYEPKGSLVVTPSKMLQFFREVKNPDEIYPFQDIFGGQCTNASISRMYQCLKCQHHLVQLTNDDIPTIPGLTPHGFECWMTTLIQAHPDMEHERLAKAVLNMPISNADSRSERFPKTISRRMFPQEGDRAAQQKLYYSISADRNIQLRNSIPMPPPPSQPPPPINTAFKERERKPYSSIPSASTSHNSADTNYDDEDVRSPRILIERERQPYTAREGTGKIHEDREREPMRTGRSNSTAPVPPSTYASTSASSKPMDVPPANNQRYHGSSVSRPTFNTPPFAVGAIGGFSNQYAKSEGANVGDIPREYYASNIHTPEPLGDNSRRDSTARRRGTLEDDSAKSNSSNQYSMPPPLRSSISGSSAAYDQSNERRESRDTREAYEERRRSGYPSNGGVGGTDGYGSHARDGNTRY